MRSSSAAQSVMRFPPRDLDFVVDHIEWPEVERLFSNSSRPKRTHFGGLKFKIEGIDVDLWSLGSTWGIKQKKIQRPTWTDLIKSTQFNIEAVAFELNNGLVWDGGFEDALRHRILEINFWDNPVPFFNLMRAVVMLKRYGMRPGSQLRDFLATYGTQIPRKSILSTQRLHYGCVEADEEYLKSLGVGTD